MPTAIVTGPTRGLGRALALELAQDGYHVLGTGVNPDRVSTLAEHARSLPLDALRSDTTDPEANAALAARVAATGVDVLVLNAGVLGPRSLLEETPLEDFERVLQVNTTGPFDLTARLVPHLRPGAAVIFVSSGVGVVGRARWSAYCVSKWGVEALGRIYAEELRDRGVRVFVVDPGGMRTEMRAAAYPEEDPGSLIRPEDNLAVFRWLIQHAPLSATGQRYRAQSFSPPTG